MFEFEDSKLGRVKILNVTEARSSIASIMNDMGFNYIITKNNKPIRVIINYDSYKKTKNQLQPQVAPKATPKAPDIKNTLAGLIGTREKELKSRIGQTGPSERDEENTQLDLHDNPAPIPEKTEESTFIMPEENTTIEPIVLETPADKTDDIYWTGDEEETQINFENEALSHETEIINETPEPPLKQSIYQPVDPFIQTEPSTANSAHTETPDYFSRYKKLYQETEAPTTPVEPVEYPETNEKTWIEPIFPEEEPTELATQSTFVEPEYVSEPVIEIPQPPVEAAKPPSIEVPEPTPTVAEKPTRHREVPSIQDLLRDLENEKLSGDDE